MHRRIISIASAWFALSLFIPLSALAQRRMAPAVGAHPAFHPILVRPSGTHGVPVPRVRINTAVPPAARARVAAAPADRMGHAFESGSNETLQQLLDPAPGAGFDYAHLAVIDGDLAIKAVIDPLTEWRLAVAERALRDTGGFSTPGYYVLDGGGEYIAPEEPAAEQPPQPTRQPEIIVLQEHSQKAPEQTAPAAAPEPSAPIPDVSNFTLVLRSGAKIRAIAFTRSADRIVYISADGQRHSIAANELDSAATRRINEERGTQLRL
jgi:hypothetical protein